MKEGEVWYMQEQKRSVINQKKVYAELNDAVTIISTRGDVWIIENNRTKERFACKPELLGPQILDKEGKPVTVHVEIEEEVEDEQPKVQEMSFDELAKWAKTQSPKKKKR